MLVRLHPTEKEIKYNKIIKNNKYKINIQIDKSKNIDQALKQVSTVVGFDSMGLVIAKLKGLKSINLKLKENLKKIIYQANSPVKQYKFDIMKIALLSTFNNSLNYFYLDSLYKKGFQNLYLILDSKKTVKQRYKNLEKKEQIIILRKKIKYFQRNILIRLRF